MKILFWALLVNLRVRVCVCVCEGGGRGGGGRGRPGQATCNDQILCLKISQSNEGLYYLFPSFILPCVCKATGKQRIIL